MSRCTFTDSLGLKDFFCSRMRVKDEIIKKVCACAGWLFKKQFECAHCIVNHIFDVFLVEDRWHISKPRREINPFALGVWGIRYEKVKTWWPPNEASHC